MVGFAADRAESAATDTFHKHVIIHFDAKNDGERVALVRECRLQGLGLWDCTWESVEDCASRSVVTPETILRWYRTLIARKYILRFAVGSVVIRQLCY